MKILIVDDDPQMRRSITRILRQEKKYETECAESGEDALQQLDSFKPDITLLDVTLPGISGIEVLEKSIAKYPSMPFIMVTGRTETEFVAKCIKLGAFDFISKPFENIRLITTTQKAVDYINDQATMENLRQSIFQDGPTNIDVFSSIITECPKMNRMFMYAESAAQSSRDILITGETGTGKDLLSRAIHELSNRKGKYVAVNVAGLDDQLFADTLFGHVKGAFTGAQSERPGLIEKANGGTLFLDEIGDLSIPSQVKLLRVLQEREYLPLGSDEPKKADIRVIAATSIDLMNKMNTDEFRKDLFFRLRAHHLEIPSLKERKGDIKILFDHFLEQCLKESDKELDEPVTKDIYKLLFNYSFPGNVRELEALVYDAVYRMKEGSIDIELIRQGMKFFDSNITNDNEMDHTKIDISEVTHNESSESITFPDPLPNVDETTDQLILKAMERFNGNKTKASEAIGMSRKGLINRYAKIEKK